MISAKVEIRGIDDVLRTLEASPKEMRAVAKKAMTSASAKTARAVKQRTPKRWRALVGYRVAFNRKTGGISARLGYYNASSAKGKSKNGDRVFDWYKAYWNNYGTLSRRDPRHNFVRPIRPGHHSVSRRRRNQSGVPARHFFETAISQWESTFISAFRTAFDTYYSQHF